MSNKRIYELGTLGVLTESHTLPVDIAGLTEALKITLAQLAEFLKARDALLFRGILLTTDAPLDGQVYAYNASLQKFKPITVSGGGGGGYQFKKGAYYPTNFGTNTAQNDDWKTWDVIPFRTGFGYLKLGVDYDYDTALGLITLLHPGDVFGSAEEIFIQFEPKAI